MIILVVFLLIFNIAIVVMLILILRNIVSYYKELIATVMHVANCSSLSYDDIHKLCDKFVELTDVQL